MTLEPLLRAPLPVQIRVATVVPAFFIGTYSPLFELSPIHIFVPITLVSGASALYGARTNNIRMHRGAMLGAYIGGLPIAGTLAFLPGRIMHAVTFGSG